MYLHEKPNELSQLVTDAATHFSRAEAYIEKDYYAMMMLREATQRNPRIVFKGGTCLSKCHHVIDRFSEDIDLGIAEDHATEGMRKSMKHAVVNAAGALGFAIANIDQTRSKREYNRYDIELPGKNGGTLIVETAVMTPASPSELKYVQSFVGEYCETAGLHDVAKEYELGSFAVNASSMERTFVDKVFAICDYYLAEEPIPTRQSRHVYDLRKLQDRIAFDGNLTELFKIVRRQRLGKNRCPSAEPCVNLATVLREIAETGAYERDYKRVTMNLLYDAMPYEEASRALYDIADFVDGINWSA